MKLRQLEMKDAPLMLEWMHDPDIVMDLKANFAEKTIEDCKNFILGAQNMDESIHLAIADDNDEYLGTVSLKHIHDGTAEFGITIRKKAMGKGYSELAMKDILKMGFEKKGLQTIFWCVDPNNERALRFYDKNGFTRGVVPTKTYGYSQEECERYVWYQIKNY